MEPRIYKLSWLPFVIPLTPWPILIWINAQGFYQASLHCSQHALHSVQKEAAMACYIMPVLSLLPFLFKRPTLAAAAIWLAFVLVNGYTMAGYLYENATAMAC